MSGRPRRLARRPARARSARRLPPAARPRRDAGFSVVMVTATILMLLVLGLSLVALVSEHSGLSLHHVESNRAFYAAQAGVEYAIVKLARIPSWGGLPAPGKSLGAAAFWIAPPDAADGRGAPLPAGQRRIVATGVSGEAVRVIEVRVATGAVATFGGTGRAGRGGDGGPALSAEFGNPEGMAVGPDGALYLADTDNHSVRRIDPITRLVTTVAGDGRPGHDGDGGPSTAARLRFPEDIAVAPNGDLYIADSGNHAIRRIDATTGTIATVAGSGSPGSSGDGGPAAAATLKSPGSVALAPNGDVLVADTGNHKVRTIAADTGIITTLAGTGSPGYSGDGGSAAAARLRLPGGVESALNGDVYVADTSNHVVRRVSAATGVITTVAGSGAPGYDGDGGEASSARLHDPEAVTVTGTGEIYVADTGNHAVRRFTPGGAIATVVGSGVAGYAGDGGAPASARLNAPRGVAVASSGVVYVADTGNRTVRRLGGGLAIVGWVETRS